MSWKIGDGNRSAVYILPMLGDKFNSFYVDNKMNPKSNFMNCFIDDLHNTNIQNNILLLYKFSGTKEYSNFENVLMNNSYYKNMYEPDKYHTMYVFNIPEKFAVNYDLFIQGKYSHFTDEYKKHIQSFHDLKKDSNIMNILYKREEAFKYAEEKFGIRHIPRHQEATSIPDLEVECYQDKYKVIESVVENNEFYNPTLD